MPTAHNEFWDDDVEIPDHIVDRTENLLREHPMTNQSVILDTASWWLDEVGNCPIYRWCIHYANSLEHDEIRSVDVYSEAREQAQEIGLDV